MWPGQTESGAWTAQRHVAMPRPFWSFELELLFGCDALEDADGRAGGSALRLAEPRGHVLPPGGRDRFGRWPSGLIRTGEAGGVQQVLREARPAGGGGERGRLSVIGCPDGERYF